MSEEPQRPRNDPILLLEVVLGLGLVGLFIVLYLIPAERAFAERSWWSAPLLGIAFFGLLGLDAWRRKRRQHAELHAALRDARDKEEIP